MFKHTGYLTKGFTLVELLIVIAIIGTIATIAIPILVSSRNRATDIKAQNSLRSVVSAEAAYYVQEGTYGDFAALTGAVPPYLDDRFTGAGASLGNGVIVTVAPTGGGQTYTCTITGATWQYTATHNGDIVEQAIAGP